MLSVTKTYDFQQIQGGQQISLKKNMLDRNPVFSQNMMPRSITSLTEA